MESSSPSNVVEVESLISYYFVRQISHKIHGQKRRLATLNLLGGPSYILLERINYLFLGATNQCILILPLWQVAMALELPPLVLFCSGDDVEANISQSGTAPHVPFTTQFRLSC